MKRRVSKITRLAVLGSTGSIGTAAVDVAGHLGARYSVKAISANSSVELLAAQVRSLRPEAVCIGDTSRYRRFKELCGSLRRVKVYAGEEGICKMLRDIRVDAALVAIVGSAALRPLLEAVKYVKRIALANKEAVVMAGHIIKKEARACGAQIIPVDSEHSAVFQCLQGAGASAGDIRKIYLTGTGGPFLKTPRPRFKEITPREAVRHPRWSMGKKISVDSATMMNKGLEVIEAHYLFNVPIDNIEILVHPEAVIHSMVEFKDSSLLAQLGVCDMRLSIQYALTYPERAPSIVRRLDFSNMKRLSFLRPDFRRFPCLRLAYMAGKKGGLYPCVLNASNEVAVSEFLEGRIKFHNIPRIIERVIDAYRPAGRAGLKETIEADKWARRRTKEILNVFDY